MSDEKAKTATIGNKHVKYLLDALGLGDFRAKLDSDQFSENLVETCNSAIVFRKAAGERGFRFEVKGCPLLKGRVNQMMARRYDVLRQFIVHERSNKRKDNETKIKSDDRAMYCAAALLLTLKSLKQTDKTGNEVPVPVNFELIDLFRGKSFEQMVLLLKDKLTLQFDESLYKSKDVVPIFTNSGSLVSALKPWECEIFYYTKTDDQMKAFKEDISVINLPVLKNDLHDAIIAFGKRYPLIRLFLKEETIDEQLSLLYSGIKLKKVVFRLKETADGWEYIPGTAKVDEEAYASKFIHGIYNRFHEIIIKNCTNTEKAPINVENALSAFAFSVTVNEVRPEYSLGRQFTDLFREKGLFSRGEEIQFANRYLRWIYLALHLCRKFFNLGENCVPDEKTAKHFIYFSLYENIFRCVQYFVSRDKRTPDEDYLQICTVFGTAIVTFLNKVRRYEFVRYLCELSKDFSCRFRKEQELAISILCTALNECHDSLEENLRNEAFKRCYSKSNYSIQQESFSLLKPASKYFENEVKRNYKAYLAGNHDELPTGRQPYYYFYYHHLFENEMNKASNALSHVWNNRWTVRDEEVLGVALAIRELSWSSHNKIRSFDHIGNLDRIIQKCVEIIPLEWTVKDYEAKRKYALAVESIAYTIANMEMQISQFRVKEDTEEQRKLVQLILGYDLFMRSNNSLYRDYLEHPEHSSIESGPDGLLICGMLRAFSVRQNDLPKVRINKAWEGVLEKERGRFKVLIARTLAYTNFYDLEEHRRLLEGIAEDLTSRDFLPYDNVNVGQIYRYPDEPLKWYAEREGGSMK